MTDSERMKEQVEFTKELAEETAGPLPKYYFKWDKRLTRSAGRIIWYQGWTMIKLSPKIFFQAASDLGIDKACEEIHQTLLHEIGHLIIGHAGHGEDWADAVRKCGGEPTQYHNLRWGKQLIPTNLRSEFPYGTRIQFVMKNRTYTGTVIKHNPKNMKVYLSGSQYANIPWTIVEREVTRI